MGCLIKLISNYSYLWFLSKHFSPLYVCVCVAMHPDIKGLHNHVRMYVLMYVCIAVRGRRGGEAADPQSNHVWRDKHHHRPC